jgi:hypothetical protein
MRLAKGRVEGTRLPVAEEKATKMQNSKEGDSIVSSCGA